MASARPIIISVVQYMPQLEAGSMRISELVEKAVEFGVDGVEIRREAWPDRAKELPSVREQLARHGLLATYGSFSTLFNLDAAEHQQMLEDIQTAAELGAPLVRLFPGPTPTDDDPAGWAQGEEAVALAGKLGIRIALENYARTPGGTLSEIRTILSRLDSPTLKTNIDIGNYPRHDQDVVEAIEAIGDQAIYVHVKDYAGSLDADPPAFGAGVLPLNEIFSALDALPQEVIYCFEFGGDDDPDASIRSALVTLKQVRQ